MSTGSWLNTDGLLQEYGTQKSNPRQGGDYLNFGTNRVMEVVIDLTSLSTTAQVQDTNLFFPAGYNSYVEKVEVEVDVAGTSSGSATLSVGLGYFSGSTYGTITTLSESSTSSGVGTTSYSGSYPGITTISDTAFVNAMALSGVLDSAGLLTTLIHGSTGAGGYIGAQSTSTTHPNYITAKYGTAAFTAGIARVRIFYRGYGTIYQ